MSDPSIRGRDVAAPVQYVMYKGHRLPMVFNNRAARITEDVYAEQYGRDVGYYEIISEVSVPKHRAIMAMVFGALVAAGADISWDDFDEDFRITDIESVSRAIHAGVLDSLPQEAPDAEEDDSAGKNAQTTPTET